MCAARSRAHWPRVGERPAVVGQVEVLDRELARGSRARRGGGAPRRSRRRRVGSSTCTCVRPGAPWRSCTWSASSSSSSGSPPQSATCPVSTSSRSPGTSARNASTRLERVHDRARPRLEQRAAARRATTAPRAPTCRRGRRRARASRTRRRRGFGNAVGQPIGSASVAGSSRRARSMCSNPSARPRRARARRRRRAPRTRRRRRRAARTCHRRSSPLLLHPTWASPCRRAAGAGRGSCRSGRRPRRASSRRRCHIHAICFGCWNIVYA